MGSRETSLLYNTCNIATEIMGIFICSSAMSSPDLLPIIKFSLYASIAVDCMRGLISLVAILFAIVWGHSSMNYQTKDTVVTVTYVLTLSGALAGLILCVFYEFNYESTDMAATPWLAVYYYIGIAAYSLMKGILYVTGGLYFVDYVKSLSPSYVVLRPRKEVEMAEKQPQKYTRVPVYPTTSQ